MKTKKKLLISAIFSFGVLIVSYFFKIIPCQITPNVPNPQYYWSLCSLNFNLNNAVLNSKISFFGLTSNFLNTLYLIALLIFIFVFISLTFLTKKKKKR